ncbi:glycosyltransferase [Streptacidiphilus sp. P02-A3a]|uniref:glycosyltransferase n=1 Tax=Streptacidiphilus sp. P02-A3a TaxID=2704468 RepID=UPI0015FC1EEE|nr:glycosyltransferase [Streptacidiphilus sp. P02-A3a]QMU66942.1 glycosyltransferase [Streptacidiphilus sp. P02-A3a]
MSDTSGTVAVVIPARNEASRIALTVLAALRLPRVGPVVVVDDCSTDSTARVAEESGARVVRQPERLGRTAAQRLGVDTVRELAGTGRLCLLFLDADLGASAAAAERLLRPVLTGAADLALGVAVPAGAGSGRPNGGRANGGRAATRRARTGVRRATGFEAAAPLGGELCLSAAAFAAATADGAPVASGPGLIIDLLRQDFRVVEVPLDLDHRPSRQGLRAALRELGRYRAVGRELSAHGTGHGTAR